jgi:hypothetical protein
MKENVPLFHIHLIAFMEINEKFYRFRKISSLRVKKRARMLKRYFHLTTQSSGLKNPFNAKEQRKRRNVVMKSKR